MASKASKETLVSKLGMKLTGSKAEVELDKLRKENALLRKNVEEMSRRARKLTDGEKSKLLEKILSLETQKEKCVQQLLTKEQEIASLRQQLSTGSSALVSTLQAQLQQKTSEAEQREKFVQSLSKEIKDLNNKLRSVTTRCQELESRVLTVHPPSQSSGANVQVVSSDIAVVQEHLRDALDKNQQWLLYDQQREAYVQTVLARVFELEQELKRANQPQNKESDSGAKKSSEMQEYYDKLLLTAKKELEAEKEQTAQTQAELAEAKRRYEDKRCDLKEMGEKLQLERARSQTAEHERMCSSDTASRLRAELEAVNGKLEMERKNSAELLVQLNQLQKSLLTQQDAQKRITVLEQQISTQDYDNDKQKHQLHKMLKELRKAQDKITRLESAQREPRSPDPSCYNFEKLYIGESPAIHTSPSILDESFLECPKCRVQYPTSKHRDLLEHIEFCLA